MELINIDNKQPSMDLMVVVQGRRVTIGPIFLLADVLYSCTGFEIDNDLSPTTLHI